MKKILVATDGAPGADKALEWAARAAQKEPAEIIVLYAMEEFCPVALDEVDCHTIRRLLDKEAHKILAAALAKLQSWGVTGQGCIEKGEPVNTIVAVATREQADEIVVFSSGKSSISKFFHGSVTAKLAEAAACPVVIVK